METAQQSDDVEGIKEGVAPTLAAIGREIRRCRKSRDLTLKDLSEVTGISPSMLSLVERGLASPSLGSLILMTQALGVALSDLVVDWEGHEETIVVRGDEAKSIETDKHVKKFILKEDRARDVSITVDEFAPNTGSADEPISHDGYEYCYILTGELTIEVDGTTHTVREGDLVSYASKRYHKIWNRSGAVARTLWFNMQDT